ncbi:MAG: hypothetical protein AB9835_01910 [Eubacteriales bacterium]
MTYKIKSKTIRTYEYNPIIQLLWHAIKLERIMRRRYKVNNCVIHEDPRSPKPYIWGFEVDVLSYNGISFNCHTSINLIKETIEALEGCGLRIEVVDDYMDFYNFLNHRDKNIDPEENENMNTMIYLPFLINKEYISPKLESQYVEKIRTYIESHTKAKVALIY